MRREELLTGRGSLWGRAAWVARAMLLVWVAAAAPARAAFPGRDGLLVAQPATGSGLILVAADGAHPRRICRVGAACYGAQDPVWSPDGSEISFYSPEAYAGVIYADGSCLACPVPGPWPAAELEGEWGPAPGFLPDGRLAFSTSDPIAADDPTTQWGALNTDGTGFDPFHMSGSWRQPAWSATGLLAAVRTVTRRSEVFVIDPVTGAARQVTRDGAGSPNWSPDGRRLAVVHRGGIELIGSRGGRLRRLTRGSAPAWAPDGRRLVFVGAGGRLFVIAARGGRPQPVGHVHAVRADWQPVTGQPPGRCQAPAGSTVLAASADATVSIDGAAAETAGSGAAAVHGCLASDGREWLLESLPPSNVDDAEAVGNVAVAGDYAAVVNETTDDHYGGVTATVAVFDLRTGAAATDLGGESAGCGDYGCARVDQLVLGADGVTAAHTLSRGLDCVPTPTGDPACAWATDEQIAANDSTGTRILDSITTTSPYNPATPFNGAPAALSGLTLTADTITWTHSGTPETTQLH